MNAPDPGLRSVLRGLWRDVLSIYYANTPAWRWLKAGTLVLFGFFCWSAGGVLLSYRPDWGVLTYVMAYGMVLIVWGPLTHLVILPAVIALRRRGATGRATVLLHHVSKLNLTVFFLIVLALGTAAPGVMMLDFSWALDGDAQSPDVDAELVCTRDESTVACHLEESESVDRAVVITGDRTLRTLREPPFAFEVPLGELESTVGGRDLVVELRDGDGDLLRRFVRQF